MEKSIDKMHEQQHGKGEKKSREERIKAVKKQLKYVERNLSYIGSKSKRERGWNA